MFGTPGKTAWRLLAVVPFVLLLGIVGIKVTEGDPNSPFNKIPGAETIQELGDNAPSTNVTAQLPKTKAPKPTTSTSASASATASTSPSASVSATAPAPVRTTQKPAPKPTRSATSGGSTPTPSQSTSTPPPPPTAQEKCEAGGGHWRKALLGDGWYCSIL